MNSAAKKLARKRTITVNYGSTFATFTSKAKARDFADAQTRKGERVHIAIDTNAHAAAKRGK